MKKKQAKKNSVFVVRNSVVDPFIPMGSKAGDSLVWNWGSDNLFPYALSLLARKSTAHRRILNDKADYISGKGFTYDDGDKRLESFVGNSNGNNEPLRQVFNKIALDKCLFGNAFCEVVTNRQRSYLYLYHQDASKCRVAQKSNHIILHHDWAHFSASESKKLPLYPVFEEQEDGTLRSIIHYKDYEPMFENYGVPSYIAGLNVSSIAYKTDQWNISRLDNSFQLSGVMVLDGTVDTEEDANKLIDNATNQFAGKPGQVMFMVKDSADDDSTKFIPIESSNEGDWKDLHEQSTNDIVVAHSWFRSLSGLDYSSGFSTDRILHEYEVALNTIILSEQTELLEPIRRVTNLILGLDTSTLQVVNKPPVQQKPRYMRIWEARKADGLDYDPNDSEQQQFLATLFKSQG